MGSWESGEPRDGGGSSSSKAAVIQRDSGISPVRKTPGAGHGVGDDWDWSEAQGCSWSCSCIQDSITKWEGGDLGSVQNNKNNPQKINPEK